VGRKAFRDEWAKKNVRLAKTTQWQRHLVNQRQVADKSTLIGCPFINQQPDDFTCLLIFVIENDRLPSRRDEKRRGFWNLKSAGSA
jgi:hypothetical protein